MKNYSLTKTACYIGYTVQAIIINFAPILFVTFMNEFSMNVESVAILVTVTFTVQFFVDLIAVYLIRVLSYRFLACTAHLTAGAGLVLLTVLPSVMSPTLGLVLSVIVYSIGSGLIEVVISPIIESCPSKNKAAQMSLLHSFYCWGQVLVVLISTVFFAMRSTSDWRIMSLLWSAVPFFNFFLFLFCKMNVEEQNKKSVSLRELFSSREFLLLMLIITCAGASEIAVSQWASAYCEKGLGVTKAMGDIAGPMSFAVFMGIARVGYSILGERVRLERYMTLSGVLCVLGYMIITLSPYASLGLVGFAICGLSVGILWPGAFSLAAKNVDDSGTTFALLSFAGDLGCTLGPTIAGFCAASVSDDIRFGILCSSVFPIMLTFSLVAFVLRTRWQRK